MLLFNAIIFSFVKESQTTLCTSQKLAKKMRDRRRKRERDRQRDRERET